MADKFDNPSEEPDYKAEIKVILADFDKAAERGGEAAVALRDGVRGLVRLTQAALAGTQFGKQADLLAAQFARAGMTTETLHNAPLKVRVTGGADIYKVVKTLEKAAKEEAEATEEVGKAWPAEVRDLPEPKEAKESGRK